MTYNVFGGTLNPTLLLYRLWVHYRHLCISVSLDAVSLYNCYFILFYFIIINVRVRFDMLY